MLELQGLPVGSNGPLGAIEPAKQLSARDVKLGPQLDLGVAAKPVEDCQACRWPLDHRYCDGAVGSNHVGRLVSEQLVVQRDDLGPVSLFSGSSLHMAGCYCRPKLIRTWASAGQCIIQVSQTLLDLFRVPQPTILILKQDKLAVISDSSRTPGICKQEKGKETEHLGLHRKEMRHCAGEPDRALAEVAPDQRRPARRNMAFREDQIDSLEDSA